MQNLDSIIDIIPPNKAINLWSKLKPDGVEKPHHSSSASLDPSSTNHSFVNVNDLSGTHDNVIDLEAAPCVAHGHFYSSSLR